MSRQIKFRGYVKDISDFGDDVVPHKGHFVFGNLVQDKGSSYIVGGMVEANDEYATLEYWQPVGNENVDESTGLKDSNDKDIYVGDIVKSRYKYAQPKISQVIMEDGNSYILGEDLATGNEMLVSDHINDIEVIGNVHTNPCLLEE